MTRSAGDGLVLVTRGLVTDSDVADPVLGQFVVRDKRSQSKYWVHGEYHVVEWVFIFAFWGPPLGSQRGSGSRSMKA